MIIKLFGASLFLIANLTFADVIYFDNGDIDEGFVSINDNIMTITSQDKKGEYGVLTNHILRVKFGIWIKDLNDTERSIAESSKKQQVVEKKFDPIEQIQQAIPKEWQGGSIDPQKILQNLLPKSKGITMMFISNVFLFFVLIVLIIVSIVCNILVLIDAFKNHIAWGILSLLIPFVLLVYLLAHYRGRRGKMFFWIISPGIWFILMLISLAQQK